MNLRSLTRKAELAWVQIQRSLLRINLRGDISFLVIASIVGVSAGLGAVVFRGSIDLVQEAMFDTLNMATSGAWWKQYLIPLLPAVGGLMVGLFTHYFSKESKGHGVPDVMNAVYTQEGRIKPMLAVTKTISSAISIGSGGAGGREGPIVQIGAAIGSALGQFFRLTTEQLRTLVGCGAAGGIAAIFNAPLGGMMFALEIIMGEFSLRTFSPIVVSSVLATAVSRSIIGSDPTFQSPVYYMVSNLELVFYFIMGVMAGFVSLWFTRTVYWCEDVFERWKGPPAYLKPAIGGLLIGVIIIWFPGISGFSYATINNAIAGNEELWVLCGVFLLKPLATGLTLGSGGSGGVFTPALKQGAMLGALVGIGFHYFFPDSVANFGAYALVGMGAVVAGTMHAPLTAMLILFEVTNSYQIILPIMICAITATFVAKSLLRESIYSLALERLGIRVGYGVNLNVIQNLQVKDVMEKKFPTVHEHIPLKKVVNMIERGRDMVFPVVTKEGQFLGIVSFQEVREVLTEPHAQQFLLVTDIMRPYVLTLEEDATLEEALKAFEAGDIDLIPVLDSSGSGALKGILRHESILNRYRKEILTSNV